MKQLISSISYDMINSSFKNKYKNVFINEEELFINKNKPVNFDIYGWRITINRKINKIRLFWVNLNV